MVLIVIILLPLYLFSGGAIPINTATAEVEATNVSTYTLSVNLGHNLLSIEAERAPLEMVLKELSDKTGTRFLVHDPSLFTDPLSVNFRDLEFSEAIGRILRNFSYIMEIGDDKKLNVTIFASKGSGELYSGNTGIVQSISKQGISSPYTIQGTDEQAETLDECRRLAFSREGGGQRTQGLSPEREKRIIRAHERELTDARIDRAEALLGMQKCSQFWEQAIQEIKSIQDDRVTALLTNLAERGEPQIRGIATKALWYNVAVSSFKNTEGLSALKRLTGSSDQNVSMFAREALQDYERQMSKAEDAK
jgi:hypothetical protein